MPEILLVDDDPLIRTVVANNLSDEDFAVHTAASEAEAFAALAAHPGIVLAVVDYCLPRPVGIGLCRQIASRHPQVIVALYTGHGELATLRRGDEAIPILSKTLRHEQLVAAIHDLLEGRQPCIGKADLASRVELLWQREARRETVQAIGRAMHVQFDPTLKEPLPTSLSQTVSRLRETGS